MKFDLGLAGKKAVIVGGARGIGRATAEILVGEGADVAICARDADTVAAAVASLAANGGKAIGAAVDVTDKDAYQAWVAAAGEELGGIDILVIMASGVGGTVEEESWYANLEATVLSASRGVEAAMRSRIFSGTAIIISVATKPGATALARIP